MGLFGGIAVFHFSVIMHYFQELVSDFDKYLQLCALKTVIGFAFIV